MLRISHIFVVAEIARLKEENVMVDLKRKLLADDINRQVFSFGNIFQGQSVLEQLSNFYCLLFL